MSRPQAPNRAKLLISVLLQEKALLAEAADLLERAFGPLDIISPWYDFDFTNYYEPEMGSPLYRRLLVFEPLVDQQSLAEIKCRTNGIEEDFAREAKRRLNLDPGYLLMERFVLASGKNYSHRIYIGMGIYADLTLVFRKGDYQPLEWTYPDYAERHLRAFLLQVRRKYALDIKKGMSKCSRV